eukprot:520905-Amphidinium_carterae.1
MRKPQEGVPPLSPLVLWLSRGSQKEPVAASATAASSGTQECQVVEQPAQPGATEVPAPRGPPEEQGGFVPDEDRERATKQQDRSKLARSATPCCSGRGQTLSDAS